jgi:hypothetical protein
MFFFLNFREIRGANIDPGADRGGQKLTENQWIFKIFFDFGVFIVKLQWN